MNLIFTKLPAKATREVIMKSIKKSKEQIREGLMVLELRNLKAGVNKEAKRYKLAENYGEQYETRLAIAQRVITNMYHLL